MSEREPIVLADERQQAVRARLLRRRGSTCPELWDALDEVKDPEIPALSLWDLGVLQDIQLEGGRATVVLTPTYNGCPALQVMQADVVACLEHLGLASVQAVISLTPVWGTHFLSDAAQARLAEHQIAPPDGLACPQCGSAEVELISDVSSTACKALYRCSACAEPFDHFRPL